jgi:hypothetical protein
MRKVALVLGVVLGLAVLWFAIEEVAAESGEVVVVRTVDEGGASHETRLWVVDDAGSAWIRAGNPAAGWFARLRSKPEIEVVRADRTLAVWAVPALEVQQRINALMAEKYGWADAYIGFFFDRDDATPIRLDPR